MKLQYRVKVKYYTFIFDDAHEAVSFAIAAKVHQDESRDEYFDVTIDIVSIEEDDVTEDPEDGQ